MRDETSTIIVLVTTLLVVAPTSPHSGWGQPFNAPLGEAGACAFLRSLYNPNLRLLAETPGSRTYYVTSDNLLASQVLTSGSCQTFPVSIGNEIYIAIHTNSCCHDGFDGMHDILLDQSIQLPIHDKNLYNVTGQWYDPAGNYTVYYENHNATSTLDDTQYGDVAAYTAMELERTNTTQAMEEVALLRSMYDGIGIRDLPFTTGQPGEKGVYQTYKIALYIIALRLTGQSVPSGLEGRVLSMQNPVDGGFYTGYNSTGARIGEENVETTSIAIMAMRILPGTHLSIIDYSLNITGSQFRHAMIRYESLENWTRGFEGSAFWDTTQIDDNQTTPSVFPGHLEVMDWTQNITFNTWTCHSVTIVVGGTATNIEAYCPWWLKYWYLFLMPIIVAPTSVFLYRHMKTEQMRARTLDNGSVPGVP